MSYLGTQLSFNKVRKGEKKKFNFISKEIQQTITYATCNLLHHKFPTIFIGILEEQEIDTEPKAGRKRVEVGDEMRVDGEDEEKQKKNFCIREGTAHITVDN